MNNVNVQKSPPKAHDILKNTKPLQSPLGNSEGKSINHTELSQEEIQKRLDLLKIIEKHLWKGWRPTQDKFMIICGTALAAALITLAGLIGFIVAAATCQGGFLAVSTALLIVGVFIFCSICWLALSSQNNNSKCVFHFKKYVNLFPRKDDNADIVLKNCLIKIDKGCIEYVKTNSGEKINYFDCWKEPSDASSLNPNMPEIAIVICKERKYYKDELGKHKAPN